MLLKVCCTFGIAQNVIITQGDIIICSNCDSDFKCNFTLTKKKKRIIKMSNRKDDTKVVKARVKNRKKNRKKHTMIIGYYDQFGRFTKTKRD